MRTQFILKVSNVVRPIRSFVRNSSVHSVVLGGCYHFTVNRDNLSACRLEKMAGITWTIYFPASLSKLLISNSRTVTQFERNCLLELYCHLDRKCLVYSIARKMRKKLHCDKLSFASNIEFSSCERGSFEYFIFGRSLYIIK